MEKINKTLIQIFPANIKVLKPIGSASLDRVLGAIGKMKPELLDVYKQIAAAEIAGDVKRKYELKKKLYYILPCAFVDPKGRRSYKDIISFSGLMHLDFDHITNAEEFKYHLFDNYPYIVAAWLSASKKGVKALVKIPICNNVDEYKAYFWGFAREMQKYNGFDYATQNPVLPLFISPDENILIASNIKTWIGKGKNPKEIRRPVIRYKYDYQPSGRHKNWAIKNIEKMINRIVDNGHPQLRAAAYSMGGYVGGGYISEFEAVGILDGFIDGNGYLSQKSGVYKKTSRTMIRDGMDRPLNF